MSAKHFFIVFFVFAVGCSRGPSPQPQSRVAIAQPAAANPEPVAPPPLAPPAERTEAPAAVSVPVPEVQSPKPSPLNPRR